MKIKLELTEREVLSLANMQTVEYDHIIDYKNSHSTTGIIAKVRQFRDKEGLIVENDEVAQRVIAQLREKKVVEEGCKLNYKFDATHSWGRADEDGYMCSIYDFTFSVSHYAPSLNI